MTRDQLVHHYQNLLLLSAIPFILVFMHTLDFNYEVRKCDVVHENAPKPELICEIYDEKD